MYEREKTNLQSNVRKSSALYVVMIAVWAVLAALVWYYYGVGIFSESFYRDDAPSLALRVTTIVLLVLNALFITYFWLNGVKDFIYVLWYYTHKRKLEEIRREIKNENVDGMTDKVVMLYCTCDDFDGESLKKCLVQTYKNVSAVILDDSVNPAYRNAVDCFARENGLKVVRRENRIGFKAGNINNYLQSEEAAEEGYRYAVILDSDEIIPADFTEKCLKYFKRYADAGIVQAGHIATRNRNFFMKLFHIGVNSHWNTYQGLKHRYGFCSMLGHGAMIKMECYREAGGFPPLVAEDLCLSIEMRNHGYKVVYAPDIVCEEEYPVDYEAFKKRHSKWTQGNMEFIKKYTGKIIKSKMSWFEKLDIILFTYNLPLTAVFSFYILINIVIFPLLRVNVGAIYPLWMIIPTAVFFVSPMLNDVFFWLGRLNFFRFCFYTISVVVLYGSMFFITLSSSFLGLMGKKAKFIVTPKKSEKITFLHALIAQYKEIIFSTILIVISLLCTQSIFPVILMAVTGYASIFLLFFSNRKYDEDITCKNDEKTVRLTLAQNQLLSKEETESFCREHIHTFPNGESSREKEAENDSAANFVG